MFTSQETFAQAGKTDMSIVKSLFRREISGIALYRKPNPFGDCKPERLRMETESILPKCAFQNGHIFIGFTNCNRFMLSYTTRPAEGFESIYSRSELTFWYKLHFWHFVPYKHVRRVSSVLLFDKNGIFDNNLLVQVTGWEGDDTRLIVTGWSSTPERGGHNSLFYVTMTSVPSTQTCIQCKTPPFTSFQRDDDFYDDTQIRCICHGVTSHSVVDRVEPFPNFNPSVQLACKDSVLLNTGNAFHMLTYKSGSPQTGLTTPRKTRSLRCDFWFHNQPIHRLFSNCSARESARIRHHGTSPLEEEKNYSCIKTQELLLCALPMVMTSNGTPVTSIANARRGASLSSIDSDIYTDISVESSLETNYQSIGSPPKSPPKRPQLTMLPPTGTGRKFFKTGLKNPTTRHLAGSLRTNTQAPSGSNTYDIFEVSTEEVLLDRSLSSYRRRRNADKEYEFSEPDSSIENIFPLTRSRARKGSNSLVTEMIQAPEMGGPSGFPRSPRTVPSPIMSPGSEYNDILRPLTNNAVTVALPAMSPNSGSDTSSLGDWSGVSSFCKSPTPVSLTPEGIPSFTTSLNCVGQVLRTYTEKEDDSGSVRTDTDDEYQSLAFPVALNLDVYASHQLELVSNSRIKSCSGPIFQVLQRTLDVELLCNEVSGMICLGADKHFSSCFDYDVAVLHVCPERGSVTALAFVLIQATSLKFRTSSRYANYNTDIPPIPGIPDPRKKYEGIFSFVWEPSEDRARILYIGNLQEMETVPEKWHPTKQIAPKLIPPPHSEARVITNESVIFEWQSLEEMNDAAGVVTLVGPIPTTSSSPYCAYAFASPTHSSTTEDEDLSD